ncbi:MAG: energy-coupling factor transporter ATPase [Ruminococcaceae bacterium]|nr:energy-coupling factor transporter ATPase [Oscillospiraceae bacterium]
MSYLCVENLTHIYGVGSPDNKVAIKNLSFSLEKGETLGIIGHTGSGKSTLVNHLNGLIKPTSGRVVLNGEDIWKNPKEIKQIRGKVGLVFQYPEYQLFEETVFKDIAFGPSNLGVSEEELVTTVNEIANLMHISEDLLSKSPFDLSGGQKRRVAIAGVLAMRPELLVLDEPTAGLDPVGRETIFKAISDYKQKYNATVIIVSHSMEDIAAISDKVLVMNKGEIAMFSDTRDIFSRSQELKSLGLGVPVVSEVFYNIKKIYPDLTASPLTVEEAVDAINAYIVNGGVSND